MAGTAKQSMTIRQQIDAKVSLFRDVDSLTAHRISQEVMELSSLLASCNKELIDRKMAYYQLSKTLLEQHKVAAKAKVHAEATEEYRQVMEAEAYAKSTLEMLRAAKRYIRLVEAESKETKY